MSAHTVSEGDTFENISRKQFGSVDKASSILASNPGAFNPPTPGTVLVIPKTVIPPPPRDAKKGVVSLMVNGVKFVGWDEIRFTRSIDTFGLFNFSSVWEPDNKVFRDTFKPFKYQSVAIFEGSELMFNGTMIDVVPKVSSERRTVAASGYSIPGVVNDCTAPISALPLEGDAQDLQQITKALLDPFGIALEFDGEPGPAFDREAIDPAERILGYLINLAKQRKLIITDTPEGACRFHTETETGSPVAVLNEEEAGITSITPQFGVQNYYSHVSGQTATSLAAVDAEAGGEYTVVNPRLTGVLRPFTFKPDDTLFGDTKSAVEAKAGRMFAGAVVYTLGTPSWRDPSGKLWKPNTTIKVKAPGAMIYNSYEFLIREVTYRKTATEETATLILVPPGVFKGGLPERLPWDE